MTIKNKITITTIVSILTGLTLVVGIYASTVTYSKKYLTEIIDARIDCKVGYDIKLLTYMVRDHVGDSVANEADKKLTIFKSNKDVK